jgi:glycogen debranching enzyme
MPGQHQTTHAAPSPPVRVTEHTHPTTPEERQERKQRIQTHGRSSVTRSIADAVVVKAGDLFFLSEPNGRVPLGDTHGYGLYYHDCRFLNGYELKLASTDPDLLAATADRGFMSIIELTNPDLKTAHGQLIRKEQVGITWERTLDTEPLALLEELTCQNYGVERIELPLALTFQAAFEPLFAVRGLLAEKRGTARPPRWHEGHLCFLYEGADGLYRSLAVYFSPAPHATDGTTAHFHLTLQPQERQQLRIALCLGEAHDQHQVHATGQPPPHLQHVQRRLQEASDQSLAVASAVRSDSLLFNSVVERSLRDLHMLQTTLQGQQFFAAGVPWFVTLFGRDSLIAALQMLAYNPDIAAQTLRLLARYQGQKVDAWRDEEPGKIMHELRVGELAHLNEVPQTPYYGTVDATPLFLILVAQHAAWTGDLTLFRDLRDHIERALAWIATYGDQNGDGYLEYQGSAQQGLINQGWKDSGDAVVNADGTLAQPPVSLVEVQGYVYLAKTSLADLYTQAGEADRAARLRREAQELRTRFNRDFWVEEKQCYALALQAEHKPAAVIASNPGQALWTGIVDPDKARQTVARLMADDMFSGWGVRTLSAQERRYNPIGYHLGTVWPHDNALIAAGFRRYGFHTEACRIFTGIVEAATHFAHHRLPEVFAGFRKADYGMPVRYPVACHPQAWAAGSIPFLITTALGFVPEAFAHRLRIVQPVLPEFLQQLEVHRLRVGEGGADLRFTRRADGSVAVSVLRVAGQLEVVTEGEATPAKA